MANPRVTRIAELKAQIESAKAEIAQIQADVQADKAENSQLDGTLMNRNTDAAITAYEADKKNERELTGQRNEDGDFIEAQTYREMTADEQKLNDAIMADDWDGTLTDELQLIANGMSDDDFIDTGIPFVQKKVFTIDDTEDGKGKGMNFKAAAEDTQPKIEDGEHGSGMDLTGQNKKNKEEVLKKPVDKKDDTKIQGELPPEEIDDIDKDERTDAESDKMRHGGVDAEEGRNKPEESNARGEKAGWSMAEGSNMWSVNEKDAYWKTQEGFDEAMDLYGKKPAWVKEPTLIWNPETQEYEEVEEEEFEDLSSPSISADIKKLFG